MASLLLELMVETENMVTVTAPRTAVAHDVLKKKIDDGSNR